MNAFKVGTEYLVHYITREVNYYLTKPTHALIFLTYRCTSKCRSCSMWKRESLHEELSLSEWKGIADMLREYNVWNFELFGGDVLLRKEVLFPLCEYSKRIGVPELHMPSNCNLMDDETAEKVVSSGIDVLYASVDAVQSDHDRIRGVEGTFGRIERALRKFDEIKKRTGMKQPKIVVNCTVSALNYDKLEEVLDFAEAVNADSMSLEYVGQFPKSSLERSVIDGITPQPYYLEEERSLLVTREQGRALKCSIRALKEKAKAMRVYLNSLNVDVLSVESMARGMAGTKKCYICRYLVIVDPYGNVLPCPFYHSYHLGNLRKQRLSEVWGNEKHRRFIRFVDRGGSEMCSYCILSVERNNTLAQAFKKRLIEFTKRGVDEPRYAASVR